MTRYAFRRPWMRAAAGALDAAGGILFRRPRGARTAPRHLLIVRLDHLGDVLNMTGLPKALKEHFSDCRVSCLVSSAAAPLLEANPFVDEVIRFDAPWFWKTRKSVSTGSLARQLRSRGFDTALSLRGDVRDHWLLFRAGIPRRIGPGITGGGFLLTDVVAWREDRHELERVSAVLEPLGLPARLYTPEIHFAAGEKERLLGEAEIKGLRRGGLLVGFQVEAGSSAKTWSLHHAAQFLTLLLQSRPDLRVALIGADSARAAEILRRIEPFRARVHALSGRVSLRELAAAADRFSAVVAPDSGPGHLLAWLGAPVVFLYSGTNRFESWKPLAESATALRHPVPCAPCGLRLCPVPGHPCLEELAPERVLAAVLERLR